jgi:hypothetical protein
MKFRIHVLRSDGTYVAVQYDADSPGQAAAKYTGNNKPVAWSVYRADQGAVVARKEALAQGRTLTWGPLSQQWFAAGWEGAASQTDPAPERPADPPPLKGGKQRITLVHELPRDHAGRILWAEDPMSAVRAMCGRSK